MQAGRVGWGGAATGGRERGNFVRPVPGRAGGEEHFIGGGWRGGAKLRSTCTEKIKLCGKAFHLELKLPLDFFFFFPSNTG